MTKFKLVAVSLLVGSFALLNACSPIESQVTPEEGSTELETPVELETPAELEAPVEFEGTEPAEIEGTGELESVEPEAELELEPAEVEGASELEEPMESEVEAAPTEETPEVSE